MREIKKWTVYKIGALVTLFAAWIGLVGPFMVSSESDALALGWILFTVAGIVYACNKIIRSIK